MSQQDPFGLDPRHSRVIGYTFGVLVTLVVAGFVLCATVVDLGIC